MATSARDFVVPVLLGGCIASTIDIGAACLITGRDPTFILHSIAGGLLAKQSYAGGAPTAALGLVLQEFMGIIIAAVFVAATYYLPALRRRWVAAGLSYGVVIFFVMNYVVVPLSAWRKMPHFTPMRFAANVVAMLLFGLIVAYCARRQPSAVSTTRQAAASQPNSLADPGA
jgi:hypothetical protein